MRLWRSFIPVQDHPNDPNRVFGPLRRCIYCGAVTLLPSGGQLSTEHIIPKSLEGQLLLLEASCEACRQTTHAFETPLLNGVFLAMRRRLRMKGRKRERGAPRPSVL